VKKTHGPYTIMRTKRKILLKALGLFLCLAAAQILSAQQTYYSTVVGTVKDPTGALVPGATVVATAVATGVSSRALTNTEGDYSIPNLRPGEYRITATMQGFKETIISGITLLVAQTARVDVLLDLGQTTQEVTVTGAAPLVQTDTAERGGVMTQREVEGLPLASRNVTALTYLVPGTTGVGTYFGLTVPSSNGLGQFSMDFLVDGGNLSSFYMMLPTQRITPDDVQEFKVETSNVTAERGMAAGATISIATKSGTNQLHGTGYEFVQNDDFNARNTFSSKVPILHYNEFGGNIGGPIKKNKLFFFGSYEGIRTPGGTTGLFTVPTAAEKAGNFTSGTGHKNTAAIYNPFATDDAGNRLPFANNQIPASMFNPIAQKYLALYPDPNYGTPTSPFNYLVNQRSTNTYDSVSGRVDYTISSKDTLLGRVGWQRNPGIAPNGIPGASGVIQNLLPGFTIQASWTHTISARMFNEARFSIADMSEYQNPGVFVGVNVPKQWGFQNGDRLEPGIWGLPGISFSGVQTTGLGGGAIWSFPNHTRRWEDTLTFVRGSHTLKAGALYQQYGIDTIYATTGGVSQGFNGQYTAAANYNTATGDLSGGQPFADFLLGALARVGVNENPQISPDRRHAWNMFVMDDWKVRSNLVLQLGLRYDLDLPGTMANGWAGAWLDGLGARTGQSMVLPANAKTALAHVLGVSSLTPTSLGYPYSFTNNDWLSQPDWKNFGPRVGIAWRPFNDTKTVIRGGFGVYYGYVVSTIQNNRNWGRPFESYATTPPPPIYWSAPPLSLGAAPFITPAFQSGEPFRSGYVASPDWPDPRIKMWNLTFQRQFQNNWALDVAYVANRMTRGMNVQYWNSPHPAGYTFHYADGSTFTVPSDPKTPLQQTKKYPELDTGTSSWPWDHSQYDSLQASIKKTMSRGIQLQAGYTRSRLMGNLGNFQDEWVDQSAYNTYLASDIPNVFYATYVISLPGQHLRGLAGLAGGGWQWSGIVNVSSGGRGYVYEANPQFVDSGGSVFPNLTGNANLPSSSRTPKQWFNTAAFSQPGPNQYGSSPSNPIRDDGIKNLDMALMKSFRVTERQRLEVRAESFNSLNHVTWAAPGGTRGTSSFGVVGGQANTPRSLQFGIKYQF